MRQHRLNPHISNMGSRFNKAVNCTLQLAYHWEIVPDLHWLGSWLGPEMVSHGGNHNSCHAQESEKQSSSQQPMTSYNQTPDIQGHRKIWTGFETAIT
jgi:hypothetical protein